MLDVRCECGRIYHSSSEHVGRHIKCNDCGRIVEVKAPSNAKSIRDIQAVQNESAVRPPRTQVTYSIKRRPFSHSGLWLAVALAAILIVAVLYFRKTDNANTRAVTPHVPANGLASPHDSVQGPPISFPESRSTESSGTPMASGANSAGADCPGSPNSFLNGARLQPDVGTDGHGTLTVDNGTSEDATIELVNTVGDYTSRYAYIRAQQKVTLTGIEAGTYQLMFTQGANWVGDDFTCSPSYNEFDKELVYSESVEGNKREFHEMSVTLHPVLEGNVKTRAISRADFHRHTQGRSNSSQ